MIEKHNNSKLIEDSSMVNKISQHSNNDDKQIQLDKYNNKLHLQYGNPACCIQG